LSRHVAYDTVTLDALVPFPGNPRVGALDEIKQSLARFGQYRTIVVWQVDGEHVIVAGNHTWRGMRELAAMSADQLAGEFPDFPNAPGWAGVKTARVEFTEFDDWDEARRVNAADNRLAELGGYDREMLVALLDTFGGDFRGSGWVPEDLRALRPDFGPDGGTVPPLDQLAPRICQRCGYDVANDPEHLAGRVDQQP
jgi:hypothetical protein